MNKAFTLVELLAIIIILSLIAVITIPKLSKIISDSKQKGFIEAGKGILKAAETLAVSDITDTTIDLFDSNLGLKGKIYNGKITYNSDRDIQLYYYDNKYCGIKNFNDEEIKIYKELTMCNNFNTLKTSYTQLEYIGSSGTQYINTGVAINPNANFQIDIVVDDQSTGSFSLYGSQNGGSEWGAILYNIASAKRLYIGTSGSILVGNIAGKNFLRTSVDITNKKVTFTKNNNKILDKLSYTGSLYSGRNFVIFGNNASGSVGQRNTMTLYYFKMIQDDALLFNYIPAKNSSNVLGLFNTVNGTFYNNSGTGTFIEGPAI